MILLQHFGARWENQVSRTQSPISPTVLRTNTPQMRAMWPRGDIEGVSEEEN